ncbi:MAG: S-layer homology domain-containing protein, partial [Sedimentibacter sp.]
EFTAYADEALPDISMELSPGDSVSTTKATMLKPATDRWFILIDLSNTDQLKGTVLPTAAVLYESGDDIEVGVGYFIIYGEYIHVYDVNADDKVVGSHTEKINYSDVNFTSPFAGGDGTTDKPYQIETAGQLSDISTFCITRDDEKPNNFILNNDIDLNIAPYNSGEGWTPCGLFGVFNGNGKTISNLMINRPEQCYVGLFAYIESGTVKNLAITDASVVGGSQTGILAGSINDTHIEQVFVTGSVKADRYVGGLVGCENISFKTILNCYSTATVTGEDVVGGLVGAIDWSSIKMSYAAGLVTVTGTGTNVGGIAGYEYTSVFESVYYDSLVTTQSDNKEKGSPKSTGEMKTQSTFVGYDFDTVWAIDPSVNGGYPYFKSRMVLNQDQEAPTGLVGVAPSSALNDGKITGTTTDMEFKVTSDDDSAYQTCIDLETTGLVAENYVIRLAAKTGYNAGATASVTVPAYAAGETPSFVAVTGITNIPTTGKVGTEIDLTEAMVAPTDPTNKGIAWMVTNAGTTGVTTSDIATGKFTPSAAGTLELTATIANGTNSSTDYTQKFSVVVSDLSVTTYALTVNLNGGNGAITDGDYAENAIVTINAGTRSGYKFKGWTSSNGGSFANASIKSTSFTMPANATTIIASWSHNSGGSTASNTEIKTDTDTNTNINVNGENINAGIEITTKKDGKSTTTVTLDQQKIEQKIATLENHVVITIPINTGSDSIAGELNGQLVKNMESRQSIIEIKTDAATYTLPAQQINIDAVSEQIGKNIELKDIVVTIEIIKPTQEMVTIVENSAKVGEFTLLAPSVEFNISCTYGDKTVNVSQFNNYVERTLEIPASVDSNKITTAVIIDADGTVRHVPTKIIIVDGKYYAKINSLTNSIYSLIWNPVVFKDIEQHWAKAAIDDMGSRMVISGVENDTFEPDRDITRAEFATIMVRALGLEPGKGDSQFKDVNNSDWYCDYIKTAYEYKLVSGYDADTFAPNDKITREQAMAMISRAMTITGLEVELTADEIADVMSGFIDADKSETYAKECMVSCIKAGIVTGRTDNQIAPNNNITRAEVAVMVQRLLQKSNLI